MEEAVLTFSEQFAFTPELIGGDGLPSSHSLVVVMGMGGSHLCAGVLQDVCPDLPIVVHNDYGVPTHLPEDLLKNALFIASSYSGNTEETLDALKTAHQRGYHVAGLTTGGELLGYVQENDLPHVVVPNTGIQPRSALGFFVKALSVFVGDKSLEEELHSLSNVLDPNSLREEGEKIAEYIKDTVPVIYTTGSYRSVAYNWKIKLNETGKRPAFYNLFPELNHNELTGFDVIDKNRHLSERFSFLMFKGSSDHPQNIKRMENTCALYKDRGLQAYVLELVGNSKAEEVFRSLLIADWTALYSAEYYGSEPEQVPMIEEFKDRIA